MVFAEGVRLGPYEIVSRLGAGGMGEVYKARDARLNRFVAIKVLPEHVAHSPELKQRFEHEARTLASLSHPHICQVFDVGRQDGIDYLVMEHLEGQTLAHRLESGPLRLDEALKAGLQLADALDKAHGQGIIHRDIKPSNVMLTASGAKLLDFGLAKQRAPSEPGTLSTAATQTDLTVHGAILGTFQYMAPEQLEGKPADARTDIFAFGVVFYEMASGRRAFQGSSLASLISAIMSAQPEPLPKLQPMTPALLDRVIRRCLAKAPEQRWQTARDLITQLQKRWFGF